MNGLTVGGRASKDWIEHEARAAILSELHARPFVPLSTPRRVYHFAFATGEEEAKADRAAVALLAAGCPDAGGDAKFLHFSHGGWDVRWEQHTEFTTYTFSTSDGAETPFAHPDPVGAGEIVFTPPGRLVVAAHFCVLGDAEPLEKLATLFQSRSLCVIGVGRGAGEALTDFAVDAHGFTRLLLRLRQATDIETGRLTQRLLEIETYRSMALLGLPEARRSSPELRAMEREISGITHALSKMQDTRTNQDLLKRLSDLLAQSEALSTRTAYRFGASRAYHALVKNRLELAQETKIEPYVSVSFFFSARLEPAIETCNAVEMRQMRLSRHIDRAIDLMRTGITFEMERQNRDLLDDMNRRARLQLRLNRIVQGISVAALSYYVAGLGVFAAKGAKDAGWLPFGLTAEEATAIALPFAVFASWLFMERVRRLSKIAAKEEMVD
jgi:uncharacterized membrane-anchored protein